VLAAFRSTDVEIAHGNTSEALRELVLELDEERRRRIAGLTIADLMPPAPPAPEQAPGANAPREARDSSAPLAIVKDGPGD